MLVQQVRFAGLPDPVREHIFHPHRKWRFDLAWPDQMVAVEAEGGIWSNGAHSRGKHFESDAVKYNEAQILGWVVLRFSGGQIRSGLALQTIERIVKP